MTQPRSQLLRILQAHNVAQKVLESRTSDSGLADANPFPFLAIVGQWEMKLALLLSLVNRNVGGVLLIGPRGTGKTTAVRGLIDVVPTQKRSLCPYGCEEAIAEAQGIEAICDDCAQKMKQGKRLMADDPMRLIELPLNARLDDVVGGINERIAIEQQKVHLERGILSYADQNLLYIDEVNLLDDDIINAILDAAGQGRFTVRRGPMSATYRSRLFLIGSMNPEEGRLRPQMQDRFGLRVVMQGMTELEERLVVYHRTRAYYQSQDQFIAAWQDETGQAREEIQAATNRLSQVTFSPDVERTALTWIQALNIESHRAEITLLEAARAYAALDERDEATLDDARTVAPLALKQRQSEFMTTYIAAQLKEDQVIQTVIHGVD